MDCRSLIDKGIKEFRYLLVLARFDISLPLREDVSNSLDNRWLLSSIIYFALFRTAAVYNSLKNGESVLIIFCCPFDSTVNSCNLVLCDVATIAYYSK